MYHDVVPSQPSALLRHPKRSRRTVWRSGTRPGLAPWIPQMEPKR